MVLLVAGLTAAACNSDSSGDTTTTFSVITTTTTPLTTVASTTTGAPASTAPVSSTSTTRGVISDPEWSIVERLESDQGATVVVQLDPESYERITDIDIQNIIEDVIEGFPPILEIHVVDSDEAAAIVLSDVIDTDDQAILGSHYFARLEDGFRIVYVGPFEDFGVIVLSS